MLNNISIPIVLRNNCHIYTCPSQIRQWYLWHVLQWSTLYWIYFCHSLIDESESVENIKQNILKSIDQTNVFGGCIVVSQVNSLQVSNGSCFSRPCTGVFYFYIFFCIFYSFQFTLFWFNHPVMLFTLRLQLLDIIKQTKICNAI